MNGGIHHRCTQTCPRCGQLFFWAPGLGLCPYCDLSRDARQSGPYGDGDPCPTNCCPKEDTYMRYEEAVTEARRLTKRSEADQWRLAELTWEQVKAGKSRRQWAKDIGVNDSHAGRLYSIWAEWGAYLDMQRPSFAEAYDAAIGRTRTEEVQEHGSQYAANARRAIRNLPPEKKAEVVAELLEESAPEVRHAAVRALDKHYDREREQRRSETPIRPAADHDHTVEVLVRLRAISSAIKVATDAVQNGPALGDTTDDLVAVVDWQLNALTILRAVLAGRSDMDAELADILRAG